MSDTFTITRTFAASPEAVFDAWVTPEHFSVWFGTPNVAVPLDTLTMDVRVGGRWTAVMHLPDGSTKDWEGEYRELDRPSRVVRAWHVSWGRQEQQRCGSADRCSPYSTSRFRTDWLNLP